MNKNIATFITSLKKIGLKDLIYPGLLAIFLIIIFLIFLSVTRFISKNINKAISSEEHGESYSLNIENYTFVAKRLGITPNTPLKEPLATGTVETGTRELSIVKTEATSITDKASLSITILNSTTRKGVAGTLAQVLEKAGYAKGTTGNEKKQYATTTISIKQSKSSHAPLLLEEVRKLYPNAVASTTPDTAQFDVTIIIGGK